ncbi:hypothetical protein [Streptococcus saliviloxodontae]|uniref:Saccharopine dehydrogenase-like NADP-dependent oxidoreductase n=1 Tax=Streptococcus saliviloxodontae TaxID=1349416 RepID=A0ABS2PP52_9STRE|nr:hypothetical protein [Streptococcus saliviloxodontae]MBM7636886.1 saccharopine dehydrogenase-like NADP-dependent oxidoreductase [Streptococcus saliviloxodontae]
MSSETIAALIGAIIAGGVAYFVSNRDLSDSLDSKSDWRKELFRVASTYELTLDHAQTVRAALRFLPKNDEKAEEYSFTWFSDIMIEHLDKYILNSKFQNSESQEQSIEIDIPDITMLNMKVLNQENTDTLTEFNKQVVRLFAMFLLKYHFEHRSAMGPKEYLFVANKNKHKKYDPIVAEAFLEYTTLIQNKVKERKIK